jgi:hypothetical protein
MPEKPLAGSVGGQVGAVGVSQVEEAGRAFEAKTGPGGGARSGAGEHGSVIGEADQPGIEGRVPESCEQQSVVHIEPLRVVTFGPLGLGRLRQTDSPRTKPRQRGRREG